MKKVLLLGSGALQIGQAGEFDYSGSQAIKALKEESIEVVLINPNIATIQTSQNFADKVYFLPVDPHFTKEVITKEKPDGILLSFGGQTALNCGLMLEKNNVLQKYGVHVLGTPTEAIEKTEDRHLFAKTLEKINLKIPKSKAVRTVQEAEAAAQKIGFPTMVRSGFSLGGQDSGVAKSKNELSEIASRALSKVSQILIEEYLAGWKEIEYEVVRDKFDNCITVCNMENIDPMGIHTGESIVVAPSQTLNNFEYHGLREIAIKVIRHLKIVGECNIQFALNPLPKSGGADGRAPGSAQSTKQNQNTLRANSRRALTGGKSATGPDYYNLDYRIIEVNARLSRSSALASKATGYPLAYVATKLALGYSLTDIKNSVTKKTIAAFEPALDYLALKIPRWDLAKFVKSDMEIGSSMQSVGEVMAIGRKFEEAIQKAARMLDIGMEGLLDEKAPKIDYKKPTPWRLFAIAQALKGGTAVEKIAKETSIDSFFLEKIANIAKLEKSITGIKSIMGGKENFLLKRAKQLGFSDKRIAKLSNSTEEKITKLRERYGIAPVVKQIDTLAAEYPAETNYLYLTYNGTTEDINSKSETLNSKQIRNSNDKNSKSLKHWDFENYNLFRNSKLEIRNSQNKILVLGSGPYRIGSSVEFDWCATTSAQTSQKENLQTIIVNCNPETVSTDYDMATKLYFEELTAETITEIYKKENASGVIVSMGGQTPNNLAPQLAKNGLNILGTSPESLDMAEDRSKFSALCDKLSINQPPWAKLKNVKEAVKFAKKLGYPVLVRPSYVLSGAAMNVAFNSDDLAQYLEAASLVSSEYPVVISKFFQDAKEFEIDAVATSGEILTYAITEHIENAGVHSGDSHIVWPTQKLNKQTSKEVLTVAKKITKSLKITGPFNIQYLAKNNKISVIECNLRASRSLPFVSKVTGINFAEIATKAILTSSGWQSWKGSRQRAGQSTNSDNQSNLNRSSTGGRETTDRTRLNYVAVKAPQFSFSRIKGADPVLRVEMASTGEVACFGNDVYEAFLKATLATGTHMPKKSVFISLAGDQNKREFLQSAKILLKLGLKIYASAGTSSYLTESGVKNHKLYKIHDHKKPNVLDVLVEKKVDLVINIFDPYFKKEFDDDYHIRRATIDFGIPILTNLQTAKLFARAISEKKLTDLKTLPWNYYTNR